jgi:hypothetical protein
VRKRLDVQIDKEKYDYIKGISDESGMPMNVIANELLALGIAVKQGEVIEQQSLPILREAIDTSIRKHISRQSESIREDIRLEIAHELDELKEISRTSNNKLAALVVKTLRDANIARRLLYQLLAKAYGAPFATATYEDASKKASRDITYHKEDEL